MEIFKITAIQDGKLPLVTSLKKNELNVLSRRYPRLAGSLWLDENTWAIETGGGGIRFDTCKMKMLPECRLKVFTSRSWV